MTYEKHNLCQFKPRHQVLKMVMKRKMNANMKQNGQRNKDYGSKSFKSLKRRKRDEKNKTMDCSSFFLGGGVLGGFLGGGE